jgi:hypothetical protein
VTLIPYENLNLSDWPFRTSADENFASVWAGRAKTKEQLERLLKKMMLFPKSGLHVFWANFGMGKTHTLYHLKYRCLRTKGQIIPIYAVMPKRSTGFLELYREIVQAFLSFEMRDYLGKQLVDLGQNSKGASLALHPMFSKSPGVVKALLAIRNGSIDETTAAMQWLSAQPGLDSRSMKSIGVTYRIKTPEDAIAALSTLINLAIWGGKQPRHILLMIDEFQRVGELRPNIISQVNSSLHTIFNTHPTGLQLLLTFSFGKKENLDYLLSGELKSRAELQAIYLDVLTREEAVLFLADLLAQFRINKDDARLLYPFSQAAINTLMLTISQKKTLTPRRIMLYANHVLTEHMLNTDGMGEISDKEILSCLNAPELEEMDLDLDTSA